MANEMSGDYENGRCCWNCRYYNGNACTVEWNNAEEEYYNPDRDDRDLNDYCDDWEGSEE